MNPNIALGFEQPTFDPAAGQRNALAMQQAQMQQAATMMQLQQAQSSAASSAARKNALAGVDWDSPDSLKSARSALGGQGDFDAVMAIDDRMGKMTADQRAARAAELDAVVKISPLLSSPETYGQGLGLLHTHAPELATQLPQEFNPQAAEGINRMALGAKGWLDKQNQDRSAAFEREKFGYQKQQDAEKNQILRDKNAATNNGAKAATLSNEAGLRKEFEAGSKDFITVRDAYKRVSQAGSKPSAAGDMAMVYSIMKMFDPNSVVRETEYATAQNATGVPEQVQNTWNRLLKGERLAPAQRTDFINTARGIMQSQLEGHISYRDEMGRIASESGIVPSKVIIDLTKGLSLDPPKQEQPQGLPEPKVGMVRSGHQFMGGDPADPKNWRPVK